MVEHLYDIEEVARFESCSAYHSIPQILFLSHCVPNPPDKGEKIRAYHLFRRLVRKYRVHLACFTRTPADIEHARALERLCESVYVELLPDKRTLARAAMRFALGRCLTGSYYESEGLAGHIRSLRQRDIRATVAFSSAMVPHAPRDLPVITDMVDVDSEKWEQYGDLRWPGFLYRLEARRLRQVERDAAFRAEHTFLTTDHECRLLETIAPGAPVASMENGVDGGFFDPANIAIPNELAGRRFICFVGVMDYYPNADACRWFVDNVLDRLRARRPDLEFWIMGRNPGAAVRRLAQRPGVRVTGELQDIRPYLAAAQAVVAPLRIARGVQNKVLEALAMGKHVFASAHVCRTLGDLPPGVHCCQSPEDYMAAADLTPAATDAAAIRRNALIRFDWDRNIQAFSGALDRCLARG